jgi:F-type H+-transporting ATPase subunit b
MLKKTLFVACLSLGIGTAVAQPAEQPAEKPSTEEKRETEEHPVDSTTNARSTPTTDHGEKTLQPGQVWANPDHTAHFNWFGFSYRGKDQYGGPFGDGKVLDHDGNVVMDPHTGHPVAEEPMSAPFVLMVLNFVLLLGILLWKGRPAARQMASERHDLIKNAIDEASKLREQAAKKLEEYETKLKDADAEIKAMVEGMRQDAEADKARILANAERQAAQMKKDADSRIAAEIELARTNLTREVTAAASAATEKLLREKMQPTDQQKLVASFINDVMTSSSTQKERV